MRKRLRVDGQIVAVAAVVRVLVVQRVLRQLQLSVKGRRAVVVVDCTSCYVMMASVHELVSLVIFEVAEVWWWLLDPSPCAPSPLPSQSGSDPEQSDYSPSRVLRPTLGSVAQDPTLIVRSLMQVNGNESGRDCDHEEWDGHERDHDCEEGYQGPGQRREDHDQVGYEGNWRIEQERQEGQCVKEGHDEGCDCFEHGRWKENWCRDRRHRVSPSLLPADCHCHVNMQVDHLEEFHHPVQGRMVSSSIQRHYHDHFLPHLLDS